MKSLITVFLLVLIVPNSSAQDQRIETASWLSGCWVASGSNSVTDEVWMKPSGRLMVGMSRSVRGGEATGYEFVLLREIDGVLVYSAHPSGQQPTDFRGTQVSNDLLRFINADHDFPQKIEYSRVSDVEIRARVFGNVNAANSSFELRYERIPC